MLTRRAVLTALASCSLVGPVSSQSWPTRTIKIVVPFPPGGPTDFVVRLFAPQLSSVLGQPVIVENRAGASGNVGNQAVLDAEPDGHTLVHNTVAVQAVNPLMFPDQRFNPRRDLVGIATTATMPNVLVVNPSKVPVKTLKELVDLGRQQPGKLTCANFGNGTSPHIYGSLLQKVGGFQATEVPYRGSALALNDVLGAQVDFLFDSMSTCVGHVKAGTLRGLAVTSATRSPQLPDVPTMAEAGFPAFDLKFWFALFASARTPAPIVEKLQDAVDKVLADPAYAAALRARGAEPLLTPRGETAGFLEKDAQRWTDVARDIGVKPQS